MKKIENKLILFLVALAPITAHTQEVSFTMNGGFQGLDFKINQGTNSLQAGGKIGVGYTHFINKNWGISSGAEIGFYNNKATLHDNLYVSDQFDSEGDFFEYRIKTTGFKENNPFYTLSIPLLLQYHTTGNTQFYVNGGARVFFPFSQKNKITINQITTTGYYPDYNVELADLPQHGFSTTNNINNQSSSKLKTAVALSAEMGVSFGLTEKLRLYTGAYLDYGLNNMLNKQTSETTETLVDYYNQNQTNSVLKVNNMVNQAKLLGYGLQIKLAFNTAKKIAPPVIETEKIAEVIFVEEDSVIEQPMIEKPMAEPIVKTISEMQTQTVEQPVYFDKIGETKLSESDKKHLNEVGHILTQFPNQKIEITGHTCNIGTQAQNTKVGLERAKAMADYLVQNGVNPNQIETKSVGDLHPIAPNNTEENRKKNRRAEIQLVH